MHTYIHTYIHTYVYIHTYIYTEIAPKRAPTRSQSWLEEAHGAQPETQRSKTRIIGGAREKLIIIHMHQKQQANCLQIHAHEKK
jgi:hypothetical protein